MTQPNLKKELENKMRANDHVTVVLEDGDRIHGKLISKTWDDDYLFSWKKKVIIEAHSVDKEIHIPISDIKIIFPSNFSQKRDKTAESKAEDFVPPIVKKKQQESNETAEKHAIETRSIITTAHPTLPVEKPDFDWAETHYSDYTQIYADLEYFERKRNLTDIGITLLGFGISIGGNRDRDKAAKNRLKSHNLTSIDSVGDTADEITITGRPNRLESSQGDLDQKMESKMWMPCVLSEDAVSNIDGLKHTDWCLCWFAQDWFHVPSEYALETDQIIRIYGEVIHSPIETEFGTVDWTIKVRSAAYCGD